MKPILKLLLLLITLCLLSSSFAQSKFHSFNQQQLDTAKSYLKEVCSEYRGSREISKKQIKGDKKCIAFLNDFYNQDLSIESIRKQLDKFFNYKWKFDTTNLGGTAKYDTKIRSEGNLDCHISFATIGNTIVYKRIYFDTYTKTDCITPFRIYISSKDINYLETYILPKIDFPLTFCTTCAWAHCDTTYVKRLENINSEFIVFPSDSVHLNYMTWFDNDTYMMDYVVRDIANIVKNYDTILLSKLLYSPNHVLALYAAEALYYLESANKVQLDAKTTQKIYDLAGSNIQINYQYSDVGRRGVTYKELKISKEKIINKYNRLN